MAYTVSDVLTGMRFLLRQKATAASAEFTQEMLLYYATQAGREGQRLLKALDTNFFTVQDATFDMVADQAEYDLVTLFPDFRALIDLYRLDMGTPDPIFELKGGWAQARAYKTLPNPQSQIIGIMRRLLAGNTLTLFPTPQASFTDGLMMTYEQRVVPEGIGWQQGNLNDEVLIPEDWQDWLVNRACSKAKLQDEETQAYFLAEADRLLRELQPDFRNREGKDEPMTIQDVSGWQEYE